MLGTSMDTSLTFLGVFALLGLGLLFGLKHATEVDHVVAISTIVSEQHSVWRSALVGGLWGAGHSAALVVVGVLVLVFRVAIPLPVTSWLEFGVALMIVALGVLALVRGMRRRADVHVHRHSHDGVSHVHLHFHEAPAQHDLTHVSPHSHAVGTIGVKPVLVGMMHGLAGSGALTLLILTQIKSPWLGLLYLGIFGAGSLVGMLLMSGLIGLPLAVTSRSVGGVHHRLQTAAAGLSIVFGMWYAYQSIPVSPF
jgi:ABC-type nickel/cobalt efflux system permease component RcnA